MNKEQEELTLSYLDFAKHIAGQMCVRFHLSPSSKEDCEAIALKDLCECAVKYDESKGQDFRNYLKKTIRLNIWQYIKLDFNGGLKFPRSMKVADIAENVHVSACNNMDSILMDEGIVDDSIRHRENMIDFVGSLTPDELEVTKYLLSGCTVKEIAKKTKNPEWKVYLHRKTIKEKIRQTTVD